MADPIDELIKEIAGKHGIAVGRDDPIMILQRKMPGCSQTAPKRSKRRWNGTRKSSRRCPRLEQRCQGKG
jgi:hypothetical protein